MPIVDDMKGSWEDPSRRAAMWNDMVKKYADKSFYQVISEIQPPWTYDQIGTCSICLSNTTRTVWLNGNRFWRL